MKKQTVLHTRILPLSLIVSYLVTGSSFANSSISITENNDENTVTATVVDAKEEMEKAQKQAQVEIKKLAEIKAKSDPNALTATVKEKQQLLDNASKSEKDAAAQVTAHLASVQNNNSNIAALNDKQTAAEEAKTSAQSAKNAADSELKIAKMPLDIRTAKKAEAEKKLQQAEDTLKEKSDQMTQLQSSLQEAENTYKKTETARDSYKVKQNAATDDDEKQRYMRLSTDESMKLVDIETDIKKMNRQIDDIQQNIDDVMANKESQNNAIIQHSAVIEEAKKGIALAEQKQQEAEASLEASSKQLAQLAAEKSDQLKQKDTLEASFGKLINKKHSMETALKTAEDELNIAEKEKNNYTQVVADALDARNTALKVLRDLEKAAGNMIVTEQDEINLSANKGERFLVANHGSTLDAQIAGGSQKVEAGGAAIRSIITEDGRVELQARALAEGTIVENGTLKNTSGTDRETKVLADGSLIVTGIDANSIHADIAKGGKARVADSGTASNMVSAGNVTAANGGIINTLTMSGGNFDLQEGAQVNGLNATRSTITAQGALNGAVLHSSTINISNTATVSGALNADKDSIIDIFARANTAKTDLYLAGQMNFLASEPEEARGLRTKRSAVRTLAAPQGTQHRFKSVVLDGGVVDLTQVTNNTQLQMGTLSGKGTFKLNTLSNATGAPIQVIGKADGSFDIEVKDSGTTPTNLNVVQVGSGSSAHFKLNSTISQGNYQYDLVDAGNGTFKLVANTSKLTASTAGILAVANTSPVIFNAELSSVNNRLDRLATFSHDDGVWLTYLNNNFKVNGTATNFDQTLNGLTLGADKTAEMDNGSFTFGGFASHSHSSVKTDYQSSGKVDSYALGAYALYQHHTGYFVNGVLKTNQFSQDVNIAMRGAEAAKGTSKFAGLGLAVKAGKNIQRGALSVTPYVGISGFNGFNDNYKLSNGMQAQSKSNQSVIGTLGVNTGYQIKLKNGATIKPYAMLSVDQEFAKGNKMMINNEQFSNDLSGTRGNVGLGMNAQLTKNVSLTSEVKFAKGKNISSPVTANVGISYSF